MEMAKAESKEKTKQATAIAQIKSSAMWSNMNKFLRNEDNMMTNFVCYVGAAAAGLIVFYKVTKVVTEHAQAQMAKPKLSEFFFNLN